MKDTNAPKFALAITALTGMIATGLGVLGYLFPESHPQFIADGTKIMYSWSARELGLGIAALAAVAFWRDPKVVAIALLGSLVREYLDFIDFFRIEGTPPRLYYVVGISSILHTAAFVACLKRIKN